MCSCFSAPDLCQGGAGCELRQYIVPPASFARNGLSGGRILVHEAEEDAAGILAVGQVSDTGNRHLRDDDLAAGFHHLLHAGVHRFHLNRVDRAGVSVLRPEQAAVDAGLLGPRRQHR